MRIHFILDSRYGMSNVTLDVQKGPILDIMEAQPNDGARSDIFPLEKFHEIDEYEPLSIAHAASYLASPDDYLGGMKAHKAHPFLVLDGLTWFDELNHDSIEILKGFHDNMRSKYFPDRFGDDYSGPRAEGVKTLMLEFFGTYKVLTMISNGMRFDYWKDTRMLDLSGLACPVGDQDLELICRFSDIRALDVSNNKNITTLPCYALEVLNASGEFCGIDDAAIAKGGQFLRVLNASYNPKITSVGGLKDLRVLMANGYSGIIDSSLERAHQLEELHASENMGITNIRGLTNLKKLCVPVFTGIVDLQGPRNLQHLNIRDVSSPISMPMSVGRTLTSLDISGESCAFDQKNLGRVNSLIELNASGNPRIKSVEHISTLEILDASGRCGIDDRGLEFSQNLRVLNAAYNHRIRTITPFVRKLAELNASGSCGIDDRGIGEDAHIRILDASDNPKITVCPPYVQKLNASALCGIDDAGLVECQDLVELDSTSNPKITTTQPFAESLRILRAGHPYSGQYVSSMAQPVGVWVAPPNRGFNDAGIAFATKLEELYVPYGVALLDIAPYAKTLRILDARGAPQMISSLSDATSMEELHINRYSSPPLSSCAKTLKVLTCNDAIVDLNGLTSLRELYISDLLNVRNIMAVAGRIEKLRVEDNGAPGTSSNINGTLKFCETLRELEIGIHAVWDYDLILPELPCLESLTVRPVNHSTPETRGTVKLSNNLKTFTYPGRTVRDWQKYATPGIPMPV